MARSLPLIAALIMSLAAVAAGIGQAIGDVDQALLAARYTARVGFPIFILTYSASSLVILWPNTATRGLLRHRRQWGLGFALAHTIHLGALTSYQFLAGRPPQTATLIGGGLGYALMYAMALTSNDWSMRRLGRWWKRLHALGLHWLWFIFTFSYFGRLFDPGRFWQGAILFPACLVALGLRIAAKISARRRRAQLTASSLSPAPASASPSPESRQA